MRRATFHLDLGGVWAFGRLQHSRGWLSRKTKYQHAQHIEPGAPLPRALASIGDELEASGSSLLNAALEVQLGMAYSRVGIMHLSEGEGSRLPPATLRGYVMGWLQQMHHLDPSEHVVRWHVLRDPHHVLVSAVDSSAYRALMDFANDRKLRFRSCLPALVSAVRDARHQGTQTLAWTEGVGDVVHGSVQLLQMERGQPRAAWRGWLAGTARGIESELDGAVRRFQARHCPDSRDPVTRLQWPAAHASTPGV